MPRKDGAGPLVDGLITFTECSPGEVWLEVLLLAGLRFTEPEVRDGGRRPEDLLRTVRPMRRQST